MSQSKARWLTRDSPRVLDYKIIMLQFHETAAFY